MQEAGLSVKGARAPSRWNQYQAWYADQKRREEKGEEHDDGQATDGNSAMLLYGYWQNTNH
jgi:hypothetical protein